MATLTIDAGDMVDDADLAGARCILRPSKASADGDRLLGQRPKTFLLDDAGTATLTLPLSPPGSWYVLDIVGAGQWPLLVDRENISAGVAWGAYLAAYGDGDPPVREVGLEVRYDGQRITSALRSLRLSGSGLAVHPLSGSEIELVVPGISGERGFWATTNTEYRGDVHLIRAVIPELTERLAYGTFVLCTMPDPLPYDAANNLRFTVNDDPSGELRDRDGDPVTASQIAPGRLLGLIHLLDDGRHDTYRFIEPLAPRPPDWRVYAAWSVDDNVATAAEVAAGDFAIPPALVNVPDIPGGEPEAWLLVATPTSSPAVVSIALGRGGSNQIGGFTLQAASVTVGGVDYRVHVSNTQLVQRLADLYDLEVRQ